MPDLILSMIIDLNGNETALLFSCKFEKRAEIEKFFKTACPDVYKS